MRSRVRARESPRDRGRDHAMLPETVFGLPSHPLVVHAVVVLVPLVSLGVFLMAAVPKLRPMLMWPTVGLALAACASTFVAAELGEQFQKTLQASGELGGSAAAQVQVHEELAETLRWLILVQTALVVAWAYADVRKLAKGVVVAVTALAVLSSAAATVQTVRTGHAGSKAVWNPGE